MRTTISIDIEELVAEAAEYTGIIERTALIHEGLRALVQREAGRRLAKLGGSQPNLQHISRRRPTPP